MRWVPVTMPWEVEGDLIGSRLGEGAPVALLAVGVVALYLAPGAMETKAATVAAKTVTADLPAS